jgi:hypothetical protein
MDRLLMLFGDHGDKDIFQGRINDPESQQFQSRTGNDPAGRFLILVRLPADQVDPISEEAYGLRIKVFPK